MSKSVKTILNAEQIDSALSDLTETIVADISPDVEVVVIGIRSRGEILADRLSERLSARLGRQTPAGTLDITLYRDDINEPHGSKQPTVRSTEIPFDINDRTVILVDDVLYTGRSARAALDALTDLGRPKAVRLAVLVDRGHHELPIQADYAGCRIDIPSDRLVFVHLVEADDKDEVIVS